MKIDKAIMLALITIVLLGLVLSVSSMLLPRKDSEVSKPAIELVKQQYESELMAVEGVVGVGIGECQQEPCIEVYLTKNASKTRQIIPSRLDGFTVKTKVIGRIEALPQP